MKFSGRGWLMGVMGLQLLACGDLSPTAQVDSPAPRKPAQPARLDPEHDGESAPNDAASPTRLATRVAGPELQPARPGPGVSGHTDQGPTELEPEPPRGPALTPEPGWDAPQCAGAATRLVTLSGNLDSSSWVISTWGRSFDPADPANTANFSVTFPAFDDHGRQQSVGLYFVRQERGWDYHAILEGTALLIGAGHVSFDEQGAHSATEVTKPLRLLTPTGPGHAVELDLRGMTHTLDAMTVTGLLLDGSQARWGTTCDAAQPTPDETPLSGPACAASPTRRVAVRANLAQGSLIASAPWDALAPDSQLTTIVPANDERGALIDFALHFRRSGAEAWDYHVLLAGEASGQEVASGALHFNPNGSLHSVTTARPLRFPNRDGIPGDTIELDFGLGTADGGSGVDGVTAFGGASLEIWQHRDGAVLDCVPPPAAPLPTLQPPRCAGERTTAIWLGFNLDPATPLGDASYRATTTVFDASLAIREVALQFEHVEARYWRCHVTAAETVIGSVDLHFGENGAPERTENIPTLRLPLPDGSDGPPIQLTFDQPWVITAFPSPSSGWLMPNGAPPLSDGCVDQ